MQAYRVILLQLSTVLNGVLEHMSRDKTVKRERVSNVCLYLLSKWNCIEPWWQGDTDHQLAAISLLRKLLSLEQTVSIVLFKLQYDFITTL